MARLLGIEIRNYRALRHVVLGRTFERRADELLPMTAVIGPNGSGKSTLMDALAFLGDCLRSGVEEACDAPHRGGFLRLRTRGQVGPIQFEVYFRQAPNHRPISYSLHVDTDGMGRPVVRYERFRQRRQGERYGHPYSFLELENGTGWAWAGEGTADAEGSRKEQVHLRDRRQLGIATLGNLKEHPRVAAFRTFLEGWYLSYFVPDLARGLPMAGAQKHLNQKGDNLANYLQYMERSQPRRFAALLARVAQKIPGIVKISHAVRQDGRLLLQFNDRGYVDPFYAADMSDGTLKMLAYLLLLEDPEPAPLVGIEEPENGLHHQLLAPLARELRERAERAAPQLFVTTHSPHIADALTPEEVWTVEKGDDGASVLRRAADYPGVRELFEEGIPLGELWFSGHFGWRPE